MRRADDRDRERDRERDRRSYYEDRDRYERSAAPRERASYYDNRHPSERYSREEQYGRERRGAYPPLRAPPREQERDRYAHGGSSRPHRSDWDEVPPPRISLSPQTSRRSSPSNRFSRTSIPNERRDDPPSRSTSQNTAEGSKLGASGATSNGDIPTGPRSMRQPSYSRPPTSAGPTYNGRGDRARNSVSMDDAPRQLNRRVDNEGVPITVSTTPAPLTVTETWDDPTMEEKPATPQEILTKESIKERPGTSMVDMSKTSDANTQIIHTYPNTPSTERPFRQDGILTKEDVLGSADAGLEAKCYNATMTRLRTYHTLYKTEPFVALEKALQELANSDVELAGARVKTSVAESALNKAKDEAEACSLEIGRIEIKEKNSGVMGYFSTPAM